jgi:penicillin-binding protein-related factor A (putative recombinase)
MYYRNSFDKYGDCSARGESAENALIAVVKRKKIKYRNATIKEQFEHIDYILEVDGREIFLDVKSRKKVTRYDDNVIDDKIWVEFKNVSGNKGWLYGASDIIVFERKDDYVLVSRKKLLEYCDNKIDKTKIVSEARNALYKIYTRDGRRDAISMIEMDGLISSIKPTIWKK